MAALVADRVWVEHGRPEGVTITSVVDGVHSKGSLHYVGMAIDLRTRYFNREKQVEIRADLASKLTDEFDVVLEKSHIHVEFDPKVEKRFTRA